MNDRIKSGIPGLDELIEGGFPVKTINIIGGPAGSAKTLFGMQFLYHGAKNENENGLYITLEESRKNIRRAVSRYNFELDALEKEGKLILLDFGSLRLKAGETESELEKSSLSYILKMCTQIMNYNKIKRFVLDSLVSAGLSYTTVEEFRRELFKFCRNLSEKEITSLLITETTQDERTRYGVESFIGDSFIYLGLEEIKGELRRTITIRKMRFTKHDTTRRPFLITENGINIQAQSRVF